MLVKNWMSKPVITVDLNDSMHDAVNLIKKYSIRMLPVTEKGELVGVISDRDLKKASASDATLLKEYDIQYLIARIKIKEIMTRDTISVPFDYTIEETAEVLLSNKISGVPVTNDKGELVGIITQTDLFNVIFSLTGVAKKGIQFALKLIDTPKCIQQITDIIRNYGSRVSSILTSCERVPPGYSMVYIRIFDIDQPSLQRLIEEIREKATIIYIVDHDRGERYIYESEDTGYSIANF